MHVYVLLSDVRCTMNMCLPPHTRCTMSMWPSLHTKRSTINIDFTTYQMYHNYVSPSHISWTRSPTTHQMYQKHDHCFSITHLAWPDMWLTTHVTYVTYNLMRWLDSSDYMYYWLTSLVTYHTCDLPDLWLTWHVTYQLPHMRLTWSHVLTHQTTCRFYYCPDWPDLTCDLPHMWLTGVTDLTWHVTFQTLWTDWTNLTCDLPHMRLTWPHVLTCHFMIGHDICEARCTMAMWASKVA